MFVIIGAAVVVFSVFGGFLMEGGHLAVLLQPIELMIIGGAAGGSLLISSPPALLKAIVKQVIGVFKGHDISKAQYTELLLLLFELTKTAKTNLLGLEAH